MFLSVSILAKVLFEGPDQAKLSLKLSKPDLVLLYIQFKKTEIQVFFQIKMQPGLELILFSN